MEVPSRPGEQAKDRHHVAAQRWATASSEAASASWHPWERRREIECSAGGALKKVIGQIMIESLIYIELRVSALADMVVDMVVDMVADGSQTSVTDRVECHA